MSHRTRIRIAALSTALFLATVSAAGIDVHAHRSALAEHAAQAQAAALSAQAPTSRQDDGAPVASTHTETELGDGE